MDSQRSYYVHQPINTNYHPQPHTTDAGAAQAASSPAHQQIKLALDVHAATIVVVRMLDGTKPQPPQTRKPATSSRGCRDKKPKPAKSSVATCLRRASDAGLTVFWLHRRLTALGGRNYVVCP